MQLTPSQAQAEQEFYQFLIHPFQRFFCLSGYAGCGKTTLLNHLIQNMAGVLNMMKVAGGLEIDQVIIYPTATTNKAVAVVHDSIDRKAIPNVDGLPLTVEQATTVYSLLGLTVFTDYTTGKQSLRRNNRNNLASFGFSGDFQLVLVDEASFLDDEGLNHILTIAEEENLKVVFIGDKYQLVSPGAESIAPPAFDKAYPEANLKEIMRNGGAIAQLAGAYREKVADFRKPWPTIVANQQDIIYCNGDEFRNVIHQHFGPGQSVQDNRIVAFTNNQVEAYNHYIRGQLLGHTDPTKFASGEWVQVNSMLKNSGLPTDTLVQLGEVYGAVRHETKPLKTPVEVVIEGQMIRFAGGKNGFFSPCDKQEVKNLLAAHKRAKNWSDYYRIKEQWADLRAPYACTVHKSQGSTYANVFVDLDDIGTCRDPMTVARLMYVAVSRPRTRLFLYGRLPDKYGGAVDVQLQPSTQT